MSKKKAPKKKRKVLSPQEKKDRREKRLFSNLIRDTFVRSDFSYINTEGFEIELGGKKIELDKVFYHQNIILICEETTTTKPEDIKTHIRKKVESVKAINDHKEKYLEALNTKFSDKFSVFDDFETVEFKFFFLYFSKNKTQLTDAEIERYKPIKFVEYASLNYFKLISKSIKKSTRYEIFRFLDISEEMIGNTHQATSTTIEASKTVLYPQTKVGDDQKVGIVSFMMSPGDLIKYGYVLRKDNWDESMHLYQRLIKENRIKDIRNFVVTNKKTFYNNIIVALPRNTKILNKDGQQIEVQDMTRYEHCFLEIPSCFNSVCIIDGQHRVYAYHESSDKSEETISKIRNKLHFLVTGLIFPDDMPDSKRIAYQSKVFLDINSKSKPVPADVILHIEQLKDSYTPLSLARQTIMKLNKKSVFLNMFELSSVEKAPIKVASIIKFALRYLVDPKRESSLYKYWEGNKEDFKDKKDEALSSYLDYTTSVLDHYFSALKCSKKDSWNSDSSKLLSVISINGFILALELSLKKHGVKDFDFYKERFDRLTMNFNKDEFEYTSSQYRAMSKKIAKEIFDIEESE